jgi:hypothetical protein
MTVTYTERGRHYSKCGRCDGSSPLVASVETAERWVRDHVCFARPGRGGLSAWSAGRTSPRRLPTAEELAEACE